MEREQEEQLYRLQADLCQVLAEPTRLKLLSLLGERSRAVKDLVEATGERQTKISQHLAHHAPAWHRANPTRRDGSAVFPG